MASSYVVDIEADGLLDTITKIHCLSYTNSDTEEVQTLTTYEEMRKFLANAKTIIGHNFILFDKVALERILKIKVEARIIDTLAMSWALLPSRLIHGLDSFGNEYGIPKPKIDNWKDLTLEEYVHRCQEDVKINTRLWVDLKEKLLDLYDGDKKEADRYLRYLMFKMECAALQQESQWKLDKKLATESRDKLLVEQENKTEELKRCMPKVPVYNVRAKPAKPFKKDGSLSTHGVRWFKLLRDENLPEDFDGEVTQIMSYNEPNPGSHIQIKEWLFSLGWEPMNFKYEKNDDGSERTIPQVRIDGDNGKELCPSVLELAEKEPGILVLEGLSVIQHRLSIFEGFLENERDGYLTAEIGGLTNTLRFKHRVLVNLPGVGKQWGKEIRGSLIARDGYELCGSDMTSLEDNTKRHYMWDYDPDYVKEMSRDGFDPHLDLAQFAGAVTEQEVHDYVNKVEGAKNLKPIRANYKQANYACIYGVGAPKLSRSTGLSVKESKQLIEMYWKRNWSIKQFSSEQKVKYLGKEMWVLNPVSGFWYSLRAEKDIFSTINQGTGVYCFDTWVAGMLEQRKQLTGQFHDEVILEIKKGAREKCKALILNAMDKLNKKVKLNVVLSCDIQFGENYGEIH